MYLHPFITSLCSSYWEQILYRRLQALWSDSFLPTYMPVVLCTPATLSFFQVLEYVVLLKLNLASVPRHRIKSRRQSFEWSRKEQLYCFARQRGPQWANAPNTVCHNLERVVRSFIVMVQRGRHQLLDWLVGGEVSGSQYHQPSGSNSSGVYVLVDSIPSLTISFFHLVVVLVSAKQLKDIVVCILWWGTRTLPQGCTIVSLDCLLLPCLAFPPFPN